MPACYWVNLGKLKYVLTHAKNITLTCYWTSSQNMDYDYYYNVGYEKLFFDMKKIPQPRTDRSRIIVIFALKNDIIWIFPKKKD